MGILVIPGRVWERGEGILLEGLGWDSRREVNVLCMPRERRVLFTNWKCQTNERSLTENCLAAEMSSVARGGFLGG